MSIPGWIYLAMGAVLARILLNNTQTQGYRLMDWLTLVFDISRIIVLWPLVLFVEKVGEWAHEPAPANPIVEGLEPAGALYESWQAGAAPIPVTGAGQLDKDNDSGNASPAMIQMSVGD